MKDRIEDVAITGVLALFAVPFTVIMVANGAASSVKTAAIMRYGTEEQKRARRDLTACREWLWADPYDSL